MFVSCFLSQNWGRFLMKHFGTLTFWKGYCPKNCVKFIIFKVILLADLYNFSSVVKIASSPYFPTIPSCFFFLSYCWLWCCFVRSSSTIRLRSYSKLCFFIIHFWIWYNRHPHINVHEEESCNKFNNEWLKDAPIEKIPF